MNARSAALRPIGLTLAPAAAAQGSLQVETIADAAGFAGLRSEWTRLLETSRSDNLFLTWEWLHTWWTHLSGDRRLRLLLLRRGTQLLAIAPFTREGTSLLGAPRLGFLGTGRVGSDYLDVIVRQGAQRDVIPSLARHLVQEGAALDLRQLRFTSSVGMALLRELRRAGCLIRTARTHLCPVIDLRGRTWPAYLAGLGSEHRYNFKRRLRKLETEHGLRFEAADTEAKRSELLEVLFELHRLRWSERGGSDGLDGPRIREFHHQVSRLALERGWLRLFVLWLGDAPAAAFYGFRYRDTFSFYQSGFDPRYRKLSVGLVSMGLAIRSAIQEGACEFDLLHGEEAYKFQWAKKRRRLGRARTFPCGPLGRLACSASAGLDAARGTLRRLAPGLAAHLSALRSGGIHAAPAR